MCIPIIQHYTGKPTGPAKHRKVSLVASGSIHVMDDHSEQTQGNINTGFQGCENESASTDVAQGIFTVGGTLYGSTGIGQPITHRRSDEYYCTHL